uniref:Odorant binding protein 9 n=1 Tax=Agrilus mali TaxID=1917227 RepID=A0A2R4H1G4_9COLE|nr:odorant binding protein 9 [Agrilus mali]
MQTISCISVLLFVVVGSAMCDLAPELQAILKKRQDECLASNPVDKNVLDDARNGKFADDAKLKKYIFCNLYEGSFLTEEGVLRPQIAQIKLTLAFGKEKAESLIEKCKPVSKGNKVDVAFDLLKCIYNDTKVPII